MCSWYYYLSVMKRRSGICLLSVLYGIICEIHHYNIKSNSQWPSPLNNQHQTSLKAPFYHINNRSMTKVLEKSIQGLSMYFLLYVCTIWLFSFLSMFSSANERNTFMIIINSTSACDFQQCGILTCVDSEEPLQSPFKLRNTKWCSVRSLTIIEYSSD